MFKPAPTLACLAASPHARDSISLIPPPDSRLCAPEPNRSGNEQQSAHPRRQHEKKPYRRDESRKDHVYGKIGARIAPFYSSPIRGHDRLNSTHYGAKALLVTTAMNTYFCSRGFVAKTMRTLHHICSHQSLSFKTTPGIILAAFVQSNIDTM